MRRRYPTLMFLACLIMIGYALTLDIPPRPTHRTITLPRISNIVPSMPQPAREAIATLRTAHGDFARAATALRQAR